MESIVSGSDDPNNQLAFVQQLVSQLPAGGVNPITINVVNNHVQGDYNNQTVQGDYNNNSIKTYNNNNNNDNSKNILTKEYFDEKVAILSEALTDLDEKVVNLSETLTDVKAEQTQLVAFITRLKLHTSITQLLNSNEELLAGQAGLHDTLQRINHCKI